MLAGGEKPARRATLRKSEILRQKRAVEALFLSGKTVRVPYLKVIFAPAAALSPAKVMVLFSVGRRTVRRATERNRIKRLMREAYRRQKWTLLEAVQQVLPPDQQLHLAVLYQPQRQPFTFEKAMRAFSHAFAELLKALKAES